MDKTEGIEKQAMHADRALLTEKVQDAEFVLVGIGGEWNEDFAEIEKFPKLTAALAQTETNPALEWLVPYLEQLYIQEHREGKRIQAYQNLYNLIKDKNYFIVTTCIDSIIGETGFNEEKIVEPCGSYKRLQCNEKCCSKLYPSEEFSKQLRRVLDNHEDLFSLEMPICPECGKPLAFNNILCAHNYVQDGYQAQWEHYTKWLQHTLNKKLCILELGVGMEFPNIIRWPFEKIAFYNQKADFFRIHSTLYQMTEELGDKGFGIAINALEFLN